MTSNPLDTPMPPLPPSTGKSPWGYETDTAPTPAPASQHPVPALPRSFRDVKSYHAHIYFDEDTHHKAAILRAWIAERFPVELGPWNAQARGPHVIPSFYFGFTTDQLAIIAPWLQLNSLGLSILIHPNTDDPRADHLQYPLWINLQRPVNGFGLNETHIDYPIYPNTRPSIEPE